MSLPPLVPPQSPQPPEPADRRAQITERTAYLRTMSVAGAIAALGVFTGLAASHDAGGGVTATPVAGAVCGAAAGQAVLGRSDDDVAKDFFTQDDGSDLAPVTGAAPATTSGGRDAHGVSSPGAVPRNGHRRQHRVRGRSAERSARLRTRPVHGVGTGVEPISSRLRALAGQPRGWAGGCSGPDPARCPRRCAPGRTRNRRGLRPGPGVSRPRPLRRSLRFAAGRDRSRKRPGTLKGTSRDALAAGPSPQSIRPAPGRSRAER